MPITPTHPEDGGSKTDPAKICAAATEAGIVVHNPPDFYVGSEYLGVCAVSEEHADQSKYGWQVADFLAWKTLFYGVGDKTAQTWLSTIDITKLLLERPDLNIYPYEKIVGENNNDLTIIDTHNCEYDLKKHISDRAKIANERENGLVIMFFAPVTPEQDICIDLECGHKSYLTMERIREIIRDSVKHSELPVMVMTPSPFTGGWMCNPALFGHPASRPTPETKMGMIARSCGTAFANKFIEVCTKRSTPFLTDEQRSELPYEDMMPIRPTELQVTSLHQFHEKIHEVMAHRFAPLSKIHQFNMKYGHDHWLTFAERRNLSVLDFWSRRWDKVEGDETQSDDRFEFLGAAFGGRRDSQIFHLQYLATIELQTCPGDWNRPVSYFTKQLLSNFLQTTDPTEKDLKHVYVCIEYRASSMILAQVLAKGLNLPALKNSRCRFWHDVDKDKTSYKKSQVAFSNLMNLFDPMALTPGERRHEFKSARFWRHVRWLSAAIAIKFENETDADIKHFIAAEVEPLITDIRETQFNILINDPAVERLGHEWLASIGVDTESGSAAILPPALTHQGSLDFTESNPAPEMVISKTSNYEFSDIPSEPIPIGGYVARPLKFTPDNEFSPSHGTVALESIDELIKKTIELEVQGQVENTQVNEAADSKPIMKPVVEPTKKEHVEETPIHHPSSTQTPQASTTALVNSGESYQNLTLAEITQLLTDSSGNDTVRLMRLLERALELAKEQATASAVTMTGTLAVAEPSGTSMGQPQVAVEQTAVEHDRSGPDGTNMTADNPAVALNPTPPQSPSKGGPAENSGIGDNDTEGKSESLTTEEATDAEKAASKPDSKLVDGEEFWDQVGWHS
ncbi:hypothetical protein B0T22DRAFT_477022 [Podospora appendiculata]|uniref:Uncharacterized protein n=1 Tax=Podospora appendiculata TaxID=314037 RepID=A0AAE0XJ70_9PEZI|nr:hypothetical protein B0T22DRAFT_477022 [Podospora appendiculata]